MKAAVAILLVAVTGLSGCGEEETPRPTVTAAGITSSLIAFARSPSAENWEAVPLADAVELGLGNRIHVRRPAENLREPENWRLIASPFRGRSDTYSALELIATESGTLTQSTGEHPHCASPAPVPPPLGFEEHRRVWVQPAEADGCLDWWTVDAFVNANGEIEAVTLDLWEP